MKRLIALLLVSASAYASDCAILYPNSKELAPPSTVELCNSFYVSRYDVKNKAVVLTSERLVKGTLVGSAKRVNAFRADRRIADGPTPSNYVGSGFDKGHMAPADDAGSDEQMRETFLMTNMTPQEPTLNQRSWRTLEDKARRKFDNSSKSINIVTIAMYNKPERINGIPIPSGYWKIIYADEVRFYYADNKPKALVMTMSPVDVDVLIKNAVRF